jgi:WD40 repeat protein
LKLNRGFDVIFTQGQTMKLLQRIDLEYSPGQFKFSHDGTRFLANNGEQIISYNINGTPEGLPIQPIAVFDAAYVNDEQIVAVVLSPEREFGLVIYDIKTRHLVSKISIDRSIRSICVDQQRGRIFAGQVSGLAEDDILIYDLILNQLSEFRLPYLHMPFNLIISHSGDKLATAGVGLGVWDVSDTPKLIVEDWLTEDNCTGTPCEANSIDITPDGRYAVAGFHGAEGIFSVMNTDTGKNMGWYGPRGNEINFYATTGIAISPDGKYVANSLEGSPVIRIYNVADRTVVYKHDPQEYGYFTFLPTANVLAIGGENSITLWELEG